MPESILEFALLEGGFEGGRLEFEDYLRFGDLDLRGRTGECDGSLNEPGLWGEADLMGGG